MFLESLRNKFVIINSVSSELDSVNCFQEGYRKGKVVTKQRRNLVNTTLTKLNTTSNVT